MKIKPQKMEIETLSKEKIQEIDNLSTQFEELLIENRSLKDENSVLELELDHRDQRIELLNEYIEDLEKNLESKDKKYQDLERDNKELVECLDLIEDQTKVQLETEIDSKYRDIINRYEIELS